MTPDVFTAWVAGGMACVWGLAKVAAFLAEHFGLRPKDRHIRIQVDLEETEALVAELRKELTEMREGRRIETAALELNLQQSQLNVAFLERLLVRSGYRRGPEGKWSRENGDEPIK